jgi:FAD binding domain/Berberine and berberine like
MTTSQLSGLATELDGQVILPDDQSYDQARGSFNVLVDQRPAAVVFPESAQDVAAAVRFAAGHGLRVVAQGTGHNMAPLGAMDDTILLKMERMTGVSIDPAQQVARVQSGVAWRDVLTPAAEHGLTGLAGSSPAINVVGYTLGGGASLLSRSFGLAAGNVLWVEVVTADGRIVRADQDSEPDLFWAIRGGGGSFGIITEMGFRLLPQAQVYAGSLWYPMERAGEVLQTWRDMAAAGPPDEFSTLGRLMSFPDLPMVPEQVRGQSFAMVETFDVGDTGQADELLAPLRDLGPALDTMAAMPADQIGAVHMDPEDPAPYAGDGLLLADLPSDAVDALLAAGGPAAAVPLTSIEVRLLGGQFGNAGPDSGSLPGIPASFMLYGVGVVPDPAQQAAIRGQVQAVTSAMAPWAAPQRFFNLAETSRPADAFWPAPTFDRLRQVKAAVDPDNIVRANHPVPPA